MSPLSQQMFSGVSLNPLLRLGCLVCGRKTKLKKDETLLTANPLLVLREEFDDWAVLFDPDTGDAFGLNPVSVFVWKRLDGKHTIQDILKELREESDDVPETAGQDIEEFIEELVEKGYAGYEVQ
jgi:SynChlorMet cassette protein ScmD